MSVLIKRIKRRALVDGSNPELLLALNQLTDGEYIAVESLQQILEKGGIENLVWFIPVKELVDAISELTTLQEKFKNEFFEMFGVPDILRGATDPMEGVGTQELKSGAAQDRFKFPKKLVARLARDSIEMMIDLILQKFKDDEIAKIVNLPFMAADHQKDFAPALAALRSDDIRTVRVDIDTDSMSFLDDQLRAQKMTAGTTALIRGLEQVAQMGQASPEFAAVALTALLLMLESLGVSKEFEDMTRSAVGALIEKLKNPPPPPPPPPDYEMMKIQVAQMKAQGQIMARQRELDQAEWRMQLQQDQANMKAQNDAAEVQVKAFKAQLDEVVQTFMMQIEGQRLALDDFKADMAARESQMEEVRLAREADVEEYKAINGLEEVEAPESTTPPIINIVQPQAAPAPNIAVLPADPTPVINPVILGGGGL